MQKFMEEIMDKESVEIFWDLFGDLSEEELKKLFPELA